MTIRNVSALCAIGLAVLSLSACGNTIRGVGRDAASTVNATQDAGRSVEKAAQ